MKERYSSPGRHIPTHEEIARRAYELYSQRGCQPGYDVDDWLQAEYELMQLPLRELAKLETPVRRGSNVRKSIVALAKTAMVSGGIELANWMR